MSKPLDENVPTIRFDIPELTADQIVRAVITGKAPWRSLQAVHADAVEAERQRIRGKYVVELRPIPEPEWDAIPDELK